MRDGDHHASGTPSTCRFCGALLTRTFVDLGMSPLCETYLTARELNRSESFYPLHVRVCDGCHLVQLDEYVGAEEIFTEYAYFSSYSESWLAHARAYTYMIADRLGLGRNSRVVEVASNDGYLLRNFVELGIPVLGIEPAANVAGAAQDLGVPTLVEFFDADLARRLVASGEHADLIVANNVIAQVPDLNSFVEGLKMVLRPTGCITVEFPHLMRLVERNQFDTIYHEHFSYFSFSTIERIFSAHELTVFDVEELPTHGGSLRVYARHEDDDGKPVDQRVERLRTTEELGGVNDPAYYESFGRNVEAIRYAMLEFLIDAKRRGLRIAGYGAPGKGNTFLNYCGIRADLLEFTVDRSVYKQGKFLPGTHIPISPPQRIFEERPDFVLILAWNIADEIMQQMKDVRSWGGRFVVAIPDVRVLS